MQRFELERAEHEARKASTGHKSRGREPKVPQEGPSDRYQ